MEFVVAGAVGRDAALGDRGDLLALLGGGVFGDVGRRGGLEIFRKASRSPQVAPVRVNPPMP